MLVLYVWLHSLRSWFSPSLVHRSRSGLTILSRHSVGTYQGNNLTRNSSGTLSHRCLSLQRHCNPGPKSGIGMQELISTQKAGEKKKVQVGMNCQTFPQSPPKQGKSHHGFNQLWQNFKDRMPIFMRNGVMQVMRLSIMCI